MASTAPKPKRSTSVAVKDSNSQKEIRKPNEAIGLRVVEGRLSLLIRKVFNVLMYHAQQLGEPGMNAPIETAAAKKYFWVPLSALARDAAYDSKDMEFLKAQLEEMQNIKLELQTDRQWTSERLIASVSFVNPKGLKSRSGQVWLGFAFPPEVHESVMAPERYTKLSIMYQSVLRSGPSLALYEICRRYATNPSKVTHKDTYEGWYGALTGNPVNALEKLPEYKYFKRDVVKMAMAEINSLTDIEVELIEIKKGRKVEQLQFHVEFSAQPQLDFMAPNVIDMSLLEDMMKLGFTQHAATDLLAKEDPEKLRKIVEITHKKMKSTKGEPLGTPVAYFRHFVKHGLPADVVVKQAKARAAAAAEIPPSSLENFKIYQARQALELYQELDDAERAEVYKRFKAATKFKVAVQSKALEHGITRTLLGEWYSADLWGVPSAEEVLKFIDRQRAAEKTPKAF